MAAVPSERFARAIRATVDGELLILQALLDEKPALARERADGHGATLLHYVAANGVEDALQKVPPNAVAVARAIFGAGAEVDATAFDGGPHSTPLIGLLTSWPVHAAGFQPDLASAFLDAGAALEGITGDGAPLGFALSFGYTTTAETLAKRGARHDNLLYAAGLGRLDIVEKSFDAQGQVRPGALAYTRSSRHESGRFGWPPPREQDPRTHALIAASTHGRLEVVRFLLDIGVDVGATASFGQTPLHFAAYMGHRPVVDLLIERGGRPGVRESQFGRTPAQWALEVGNEEIAGLLNGAPGGGVR